jgi:hypothetical protein
MLSRLEQTIAIIQQFFIAERAVSLQFDLVAKQIRDCHSGPLSYRKKINSIESYRSFDFNKFRSINGNASFP